MSDQPKPATGAKCPTCGYQLVVLDNDELVKLTEKAAYHELRQQLAAERSKCDTAIENCMVHRRIATELRQQLAERDDRISWQELYEKTNEQLAAATARELHSYDVAKQCRDELAAEREKREYWEQAYKQLFDATTGKL